MLLFDPPAIRPARRVRCRQIGEDDLDGLADLLARGFAGRRRDHWLRGFARWQHLPAVQGMPRYGYLLEGASGAVGAILLIASRRGERILCNLPFWHVDPAFRAHAALLLSLATRHSQVTYWTSPAPRAWRLLQAQGFRPCNFGRSIVLALPGTGRVREAQDEMLPEARLLCDHRAMGAVTLCVEKDGALLPFVFKPCRLENPPVKTMELIYCRDMAAFKRCAPALARHFIARGYLAFLIDGRVDGLLSTYLEGREPRYYKGAAPPPPNDLGYSEKILFG
jgi:hypothetical protein